MFEPVAHRFVDELVGDGFLCLVLVARLGGEVGGDENETFLDIAELYRAFALIVLVGGFEVAVYLRSERLLHSAVGAAAVFEPGRVVIMLDKLDLVGERYSDVQLHLVLVLVLAVSSHSLRCPVLRSAYCSIAHDLFEIVGDPVFVAVFLFLEGAVLLLTAVNEQKTVIDYGLAAENIVKIVVAYVDIGENIEVGLPFDDRPALTRGLCADKALSFLVARDIEALLEAKGVVPCPVIGFNGHVLGGELRRAKTETVQTECEGVVVTAVVVVLSARVQSAERKLPVVLVLVLVEVYRDTAPHIRDLKRHITKAGYGDAPAVALSRFIYRVREYLEYRVPTALNAVRAEYDSRAFSYLIGSFKGL